MSPKRKIDKMEMVRDIRAGMGHSELRKKYQLSAKELKKAVQQLVDERESLVKEIVKDIRDGMSDAELMKKHHLSSKGLQITFMKLVKGKFIDRSEVEDRLPSYGQTITVTDGRDRSRAQPAWPVAVYEEKHPETKGKLKDISETGVQVAGIQAEVDEIKTLVVPQDFFGEFATFSFDAKCRWVKRVEDDEWVAGFEIVQITNSNNEELRFLIQAQTVIK